MNQKKMKNSFYLLTSFLFLILSFFHSIEGVAQNKRPNILVIMGDDISRNSMGVYGSKYIKTPNFDRIANEGALFTNAYVVIQNVHHPELVS